MTTEIPAAPPVRLRLDISYDGTDFVGWAVQPERRTVAGVLGEALAVLFRTPVSLVVAGRTDSGVHATGQVAHLDVDRMALISLTPRHRDRSLDQGCAGLRRRLAGLLPPDVRVRAVTVAPAGFDARFSALRRHYRYRISTADWGVDPLHRSDVFARPRPLDAVAMQRAADTLLGLRDFATFCKARPDGTTIRELQQLSITTDDDDVVITVAADAFCHSMVRSLVGVLIAVGEGRMPITEPAVLLQAKRRTSSVHTAPARGLTLVGVDYPADTALAARSAATRAQRSDLDVRTAAEAMTDQNNGASRDEEEM
ncbi:tRNA pseudouridine(38-40) synthase TruA [Nakamurella lactea]|uniref:tRNA pseudouridine(38-40) synthase TruA n=1 Tax=Nakamurella lactea TaxID=459515 RepID=UPI000413999B|nr:tRNA pseudouridine(38-40) synthase TruA [Nakamurella lactea]